MMRRGFGGHMRGFGGLRTFVLYLLNEKPMKGSDVIKELETRTMSWWKPSPGTIYPLLSKMEQEGLCKRLEDNSYEITDEGREELESRSAFTRGFFPFDRANTVSDMIREIENYIKFFTDAPEQVKGHEKEIEKLIQDLQQIIKK